MIHYQTREFVDAQEQAMQTPDTVQVPEFEELIALQVGDSVKVCVDRERFWVTVNEIEGNTVRGTIDNDLVYSAEHGLYFEDLIEFQKKHIYDIL